MTTSIPSIKRVNGTFWERLINGPALYLVWLPVVAACMDKVAVGVFAYSVTVVIYIIIDLIVLSSFDLQTVYCANGRLNTPELTIAPSDIRHIREIHYSGPRNSWTFIEIAIEQGTGPTRLLFLGKPAWFKDRNPSVDIILAQFPVLSDMVAPDHFTSRKKRVRNPPRAELHRASQPFERHAVNPASRYKDPYFQRRQRE